MNITKTLLLSTALFTAAPAMAEVSYQHIRNATAKIQYGGTTFLVDPYLAAKGTYPGFEGTVNSQQRNPLIDMKPSVDELIQGVDAVVVTHTHDDHWDEAAQKLLPKNLPVFVQNAHDAKIIRNQGFQDVRIVGKNTEFNRVRLSKTGGQHGTDQMYSVPMLAELLGDAMGVVFQAPDEKSLYLVGDTLWNHHVDNALKTYQPDIVVMNTGNARLQNMDGGIIMGLADVGKMAKTAPKASIITVHMDAVNHATVSRQEMRRYVQANRLNQRVAVPKEGEILKY